MELSTEPNYNLVKEDTEVMEDTFLGFSPERENQGDDLKSLVMKFEHAMEKITAMACPVSEIPIAIKNEPTDATVPEPEAKKTDVPDEKALVEPEKPNQESEPSKNSETENSVDTLSSQGSVKSDTTSNIGLMRPFMNGWRREVNLKEKDVCYIHPFGARFKNMHDLSQQLTDGLSAENFSFELHVLGAGPENEIVTRSVRKSGRVPIPSSNYKIAERLEEETRKRVTENNGQVSPTKRGKLVLKLKSGRPENRENEDKGLKKRQSHSRNSLSHFRSNKKTNWVAEKVEEEPRRNCTLKCPMAMGMIPSLQCCICLCLYHPECAEVGRTGSTKQIHAYVCKSCRSKPEARKPGDPAPIQSSAAQRNLQTPALPQPAPPLPPPILPQHQTAPQHIITLNRRRFVMVPNYLASLPSAVPPATPANNPPSEPNLNPTIPPIKLQVPKKVTDTNPTENLTYFVSNACRSYTILLKIFKLLPVNDLGRLAQVCVLFRDLTQHPCLWDKIKLEKSISDWVAFSEIVKKRRTRILDLTRIHQPSENELTPLMGITNLEKIYFSQISLKNLKLFLHNESNLRLCHAEISDGPEDTGLEIAAQRLEVLHLRNNTTSPIALKTLELGSCAANLTTLSLLSFTNWQSIDLSGLKQLTKLRDLMFGDCVMVPLSFCNALATLTQLVNVRLEVGGSACPLIEILETLQTLPNLKKLELVHFDCLPGFEKALANMTNLERLLIIPLFEFQMAAKVNGLLSAIFNLKNNLTEICWVFLVELIQVSEMFFNQGTIRRAAGIDSFVPVTLPLPLPDDTNAHATFWSEISQGQTVNNYVPVSLSQIRIMLSYALSKTKTQLLVLSKKETLQISLDDLLC